MATKKNIDVRTAMLLADVRQYEVANAMGVTEEYFSKLLRYELGQDKKDRILNTIDQLKAERATT